MDTYARASRSMPSDQASSTRANIDSSPARSRASTVRGHRAGAVVNVAVHEKSFLLSGLVGVTPRSATVRRPRMRASQGELLQCGEVGVGVGGELGDLVEQGAYRAG